MAEITPEIKQLLKEAFEAGEEYWNECHCGKCDYCIDVKQSDAPNFERWFNNINKKCKQ